MHSIFVLRLFNDCFAMLFAYVAVLLFQSRRWVLGAAAFSLGVSVKMNVLLMVGRCELSRSFDPCRA